MSVAFAMALWVLSHGAATPRVYVEYAGADRVGRLLATTTRARLSHSDTYRLAASRLDADYLVQVISLPQHACNGDAATLESAISISFVRPGAPPVYLGSMLEMVGNEQTEHMTDLVLAQLNRLGQQGGAQ